MARKNFLMEAESDPEYSLIQRKTSLENHSECCAQCSQTPPNGEYRVRDTQLRWSLVLNGVLFLTLLWLGKTQLQQHLALNRDIRRCSTFSPVHDLLDLNMQTEMMNGTLWPPKEPSVGRQMPNDKADQTWEEWELMRILPITHNDIVSLGKDPSTVVKLEDEIWGLGDDAYAGAFDVFHQLHCLNMLRKTAYGEHYNMSMVDANLAEPTMKEMHINHCVDILVQALQCSGNVNILTYDWLETQDYPFLDMSANRKCIDFDKLTEWRKDNTIDVDKYRREMKKPAGVREKPMDDAYYAYFNLEKTQHS